MADTSSSALIIDQGQRVLLRIRGRLYELTQNELRTLLGLPPGSPGLGITIDRNRFRFEFVADHQTVELSADQLRRRLGKRLTTKV